MIEQAAAREGSKIDEWFVDHETAQRTTAATSSASRSARPKAASPACACCAWIASPGIPRDALRISRQFIERCAKLKFVETPADLETPEGKFQFTQYAAFAAFEHARLRARTTAGRNKKMDRGKGRPDSWNLGYGFTVGGDAPRIVEKEAEVVNQVFRWRQQGKSFRRIAGLLQSRGVKPPKAAYWSPQTIRGMLHNTMYVGQYQRCGHTWDVPAIVSRELFDDVQRKMRAVYERLVGRPSWRYLLRGMLFCRCSRRMHGTECSNGSGGKWRHYRCDGKHHRNPSLPAPCSAPRVSARLIEELVWRHIWRLLSDPARFQRLAEALAAEERAKAPTLRDPARELESLRRRDAKILEMAEAGLYTIAAAKDKVATLRKRIAALEIEAGPSAGWSRSRLRTPSSARAAPSLPGRSRRDTKPSGSRSRAC
jgi:hypothetical protein